MYSAMARRYGFTQHIGQTTPSGRTLLDWHQRLLKSAHEESRDRRVCLAVGVAIELSDCLLAIGMCHVAIAFSDHPARNVDWQFGAGIGGAICVFMLLVAAITKPEGRAEMAQRCMESGSRSNAQNGGGLIGLMVIVLMFIALYGGFAIVEAVRRSRMARRLSMVDRLHAARVMSDICASPTGVTPRELLTCGETETSLRAILALLILEGWIDYCDGNVSQRAPAMRRLTHRHPLAEIFESAI